MKALLKNSVSWPIESPLWKTWEVQPGDVFIGCETDAASRYGIRRTIDPTWIVGYKTPEERDKQLAYLNSLCQRSTMLDGLKKYIQTNSDVIFTVAFVAVLDQFLFEGAFRERIKTLVEGFLTKAESKTTTSLGA